MQQVLGYSALMTGFAWLAASVISAALAGLSQMLVTRASAKLVMAAGMILIGARDLVGNAGPGAQAVLGGPRRAVPRDRRRHRLHLHPSVDRRARRRGGARCQGGLKAAQHLQQLDGAIGVAVASTVAATALLAPWITQPSGNKPGL
jgi:hypothetical protein